MKTATNNRLCDVLAAIDARNTSRILRTMGALNASNQARELVRIHLRRAAIAKATGAV